MLKSSTASRSPSKPATFHDTLAALRALAAFARDASETAEGDLLGALVSDDLDRAAAALEEGAPVSVDILRMDAARLALDGGERGLMDAEGLRELLVLVVDSYEARGARA